jgi:leukotriene-A4 hydrolase
VQDSPSHKLTYTSRVQSSIPILMSALAAGRIEATETHPGDAVSGELESGEKVYEFKQPIGIPSYLIAIVGGDLVFSDLGPRVGVWAEPPMAKRAEWEFKTNAHRYLTAAEETISPYSWSRFDSVVLPPSFPYGGMENANLTTLTPSLICGDRSQCDVLLHELSHSWSGNLTSCATWSE